ncbi:amino acid permease-domain-containing protein [Morchella snyderi]|nr:amino acid permease-domain-containing protein [Morchella snyderi]
MSQSRHIWELELEPLDQEDREVLEEAERDPNAITTSTTIAQKLGLFSTCCMIINRIIGTGIFSTPATILKATGSPGASLLLWAAGAFVSFAGLMVYMEFGLSTPRYIQDGQSKILPRSGGEKNYLEYVFRRPRYLITCVYGVLFIVLGNTSGNAISFGQHALRASGVTEDEIDSHEWKIKGIAIAAITGACLLHGSWRAGGIYVNNLFASIKCLMLVVFIIAGAVYSGKGGNRNTHNLDLDCSFVNSSENGTAMSKCPQNRDMQNNQWQMYGFSQSFLLVIFAYGGFENANYILSEIDRPKRTYKLASLLSLGLVTFLYMLVNIVYFLVIPRGEFVNESTQLALEFFKRVIGGKHSARVDAAVASFIAFSSFGNIIVVTFVGSRVKQEIAKEGVLPYSRLIASDMQTPFSWLRNAMFRSPDDYKPENTPVAALFLHWIFSFILIIAPGTTDAYLFLLLLHSYALHVCAGFILAVGLLYLHFQKGSVWRQESGFQAPGRWIWALLYAVVNAFLICVAWFPPPDKFKTLILDQIRYNVYPIVVFALIGAGVLYWVGFAHIYPRYSKRVLDVKRTPITRNGVQIYEAVFFNWVVPDLDKDDDVESHERDSSSICR